MSESTHSFGVLLRLTPTEAGGRKTPLAGGNGEDVRFQYRPNWGLPGMKPPDQTAAPVLAFSREHIKPGEAVRAVIVPPYPEMVPRWATVDPGTELPMYEDISALQLGERFSEFCNPNQVENFHSARFSEMYRH